jgi:hypothetical protein
MTVVLLVVIIIILRISYYDHDKGSIEVLYLLIPYGNLNLNGRTFTLNAVPVKLSACKLAAAPHRLPS